MLAHLDTINGNINNIAFEVPTQTQAQIGIQPQRPQTPLSPGARRKQKQPEAARPGNGTANTQVPPMTIPPKTLSGKAGGLYTLEMAA